jgi:tRNA pseudouridine55 synthase
LKRYGEGFLSIDKPGDRSSFSVVAAVRRELQGIKVGHAGTLDPAASGLLVLALGNATRLLPFVPLEPKQYRFGICFGVETDTLDAEGSVLRSRGSIPDSAALEKVLPRFCGVLSQVPPDFSAIKISGVRAYDLARKGKRLELAPRRIEIYSLQLLQYDASAGRALLDVTCSGGTYIRSLARDVAESLGSFGYASPIRRIAAGRFHVDQALAFEKLEQAGKAVRPVHEVLRGLPSITVDAEQRARLAQGRDIICERIAAAGSGTSEDIVYAFDNEDNIIAVLKRKEDGRYHPVKVFIK